MNTYAAAAKTGMTTSNGSHDSSRNAAITRTYARARAARALSSSRSQSDRSRAPAGITARSSTATGLPAGIGQSPPYQLDEHVLQRRIRLFQPHDAGAGFAERVDDRPDGRIVLQPPRQLLRAVQRRIRHHAEDAGQLP